VRVVHQHLPRAQARAQCERTGTRRMLCCPHTPGHVVCCVRHGTRHSATNRRLGLLRRCAAPEPVVR
jgi:hypothetical protein